MPNNSSPSVLKIVLLAITVIALMIAMSIGLGWINLFADRPMKKYQAETDAQVYDSSRQAVQGMNRDIARYCEQMRDESRPLSSRKAVAALIRSNISTFNGQLTDDNQACAAEAKDL